MHTPNRWPWRRGVRCGPVRASIALPYAVPRTDSFLRAAPWLCRVLDQRGGVRDDPSVPVTMAPTQAPATMNCTTSGAPQTAPWQQAER